MNLLAVDGLELFSKELQRHMAPNTFNTILLVIGRLKILIVAHNSALLFLVIFIIHSLNGQRELFVFLRNFIS